jgi:hypothetical protein
MTASTLEVMRIDVERRMRRGERFADVEDVINTSDLRALRSTPCGSWDGARSTQRLSGAWPTATSPG